MSFDEDLKDLGGLLSCWLEMKIRDGIVLDEKTLPYARNQDSLQWNKRTRRDCGAGAVWEIKKYQAGYPAPGGQRRVVARHNTDTDGHDDDELLSSRRILVPPLPRASTSPYLHPKGQ